MVVTAWTRRVLVAAWNEQTALATQLWLKRDAIVKTPLDPVPSLRGRAFVLTMPSMAVVAGKALLNEENSLL